MVTSYFTNVICYEIEQALLIFKKYLHLNIGIKVKYLAKHVPNRWLHKYHLAKNENIYLEEGRNNLKWLEIIPAYSTEICLKKK